MEEHVSTTTTYTRMGKSFVQTASTSALAWTVLLDVSPSAHASSSCLSWAACRRGGSKYLGGAVNNSSALRPQREEKRALWRRDTWKSTAKTAERLKMTSPAGMSWLLCGEEDPSLYPVSSFTFFFFWFPLEPNIRRYMWNDRLSMKCHVVALLHFPLGLNLILFRVQLLGLTHCWQEESSVCSKPQLGPPAPSPVAPECPPGWPTATPSASWWKRLVSVKSTHAAKWHLTDWRYILHFYCPKLWLDLPKIHVDHFIISGVL